MKLSVDKAADALYLRLDDSPIIESVEECSRMNEVVGVEMLHLSKRSSNVNLSALQFETV